MEQVIEIKVVIKIDHDNPFIAEAMARKREETGKSDEEIRGYIQKLIAESITENMDENLSGSLPSGLSYYVEDITG